MLMLLEPGD
jgi:transposase